ncbi:MAG: ASCH domain-containing protein [Phycisphaerales bacterium JB037]
MTARGAAVHVAFVRDPYARLMLAGRKTIEARLSRVRCEPFGRVRRGERIYFKTAAGYAATAVVSRIEHEEDLTPARVRAIRRARNASILGSPGFWEASLGARFATLIHLARLEATACGPAVSLARGDRRAWLTLDAAACVYPACLSGIAGRPNIERVERRAA